MPSVSAALSGRVWVPNPGVAALRAAQGTYTGATAANLAGSNSDFPALTWAKKSRIPRMRTYCSASGGAKNGVPYTCSGSGCARQGPGGHMAPETGMLGPGRIPQPLSAEANNAIQTRRDRPHRHRQAMVSTTSSPASARKGTAPQQAKENSRTQPFAVRSTSGEAWDV